MASLLNLVCFSCASAGIALKDIFTAVTVFGQHKNNQLDVGLRPFPASTGNERVMELATLKRTKHVVHLNAYGGLGHLELQKMLGLGLSACETTARYLDKLLSTPNN
jgi:ribonuclease PH